MALNERLHVVVFEIDDEETEGGDVAGRRRDERRAQVQEVDEPPGQQRTGAAEGHQRVVARVEPALHRHLLDGIGLVPGRNLEDSLGGARGIEAEGHAERGDPLLGERADERDLAAEQMRRDPAEQQVGIGDGGLGAAAPVAARAGIGARAPRPHLEAAVGRDPGDAAAAGAHGDDVDHRHLDGEPAHRALGGEFGHTVLDETHVGARPAGVGGEDAVEAGGLGEEARAEGARRRSAQDRRDRLARHLARRDDAAVGLHDVEGRAGAQLAADP